MTSADLPAWIQTFMIIVGFRLAYQQFIRWREEIIGSKQIDLAIQIGKSAIRVREGFEIARSPGGTSLRHNPDITPEEMEKLQTEHQAQEAEYRVRSIRDPLNQLKELVWEASLIFDTKFDADMQKYMQAYWVLLRDFRVALLLRMDGLLKATDPRYHVVYFSSEEDEFGLKIAAITEQIQELAKKTIKPAKNPPYDPGAEWRKAS
jgi:hypothetical protein